MADGTVGLSIAKWLIANWRDDLSLIVTTGFNDITKLAALGGVPAQTTLGELPPERPDLGLLAWWPNIIKAPLLDYPKEGFVNTHPSLLPHNRGRNYNFWALVEGSPFGVTLHRVDGGVDTGPIYAQKQIPVTWEDTGATLYSKAAAGMIELFKETYPRLRTGSIHATPQDKSVGTFHRGAELEAASRIDLDKNYSGRDLLNLLRARTFPPHPGAWFEEDGVKYEVRVDISRQ